MEKYIKTPITEEIISELKAGDYVYITGTIYTARDAAHQRMYDSIRKTEPLPFELMNNIIYYLDLLRRGKAGSSDRRGQPQAAVWTNIPLFF